MISGRSKDGIHEQIINTQSGKWILGKKSEDREIFLIFDDKRDKLNEVYGMFFPYGSQCDFNF